MIELYTVEPSDGVPMLRRQYNPNLPGMIFIENARIFWHERIGAFDDFELDASFQGEP